MEELDVDELKQQAICWKCVGEAYLSTQIKRDGQKRPCRYCGKKAASFTLEEAAGTVKDAFKSHYLRTQTDMNHLQLTMHKDPESTYDWEREGELTAYAIMNAANIG